MDSIQQGFKAFKNFNDRLSSYIIENLKELGFEFKDDSDLLDFVSKRVVRVNSLENPNEWRLYVDYETKDQKLFGIYNDSVSFSYEDSKIIVTFG